ncbi:glutamate decarboxylase [Patescibacteria group bacterium]|nr:glutamate decarboxylase [Patescibacteria group bacterium]
MHQKKKDTTNSGHASTYSTRYFDEEVPKYEMPKTSMPSNAAYQLIHDELNMDGNPSLNLASFVTTWMEPEADKLIQENINKNFIDHDEYPQTEIIHERVVNMLARLFNSPKDCESMGTVTIGSSEAIMLGLLAHKWTWKNKRKAEGKPYDKPNIVYGADVHVCWEKFAKYFDVEMRSVPMEEDRYIITPKEIEGLIDENTIAVGAILGTTFTGQADAIKEINDLLVTIKKEKGWDIPLHVDGASGGFVAPFVYPDLEWDFRLEQVKTINVSGHKYGLVYPGAGWLVFRDKSDIPEDIVFKVNYLGGEMPTYTLNFSRGGSMVIAQYYNLIRLGVEGYKKIMTNVVDNAKYLSEKLLDTGLFDTLNPTQLLPVVAVKLKSEDDYTVFDLTSKLRERGWIIPAYTLPPNAEKVAIMRVVVKENFSRDMADMLLADINNACETLKKTAEKKKAPTQKGVC